MRVGINLDGTRRGRADSVRRNDGTGGTLLCRRFGSRRIRRERNERILDGRVPCRIRLILDVIVRAKRSKAIATLQRVIAVGSHGRTRERRNCVGCVRFRPSTVFVHDPVVTGRYRRVRSFLALFVQQRQRRTTAVHVRCTRDGIVGVPVGVRVDGTSIEKFVTRDRERRRSDVVLRPGRSIGVLVTGHCRFVVPRVDVFVGQFVFGWTVDGIRPSFVPDDAVRATVHVVERVLESDQLRGTVRVGLSRTINQVLSQVRDRVRGNVRVRFRNVGTENNVDIRLARMDDVRQRRFGRNDDRNDKLGRRDMYRHVGAITVQSQMDCRLLLLRRKLRR